MRYVLDEYQGQGRYRLRCGRREILGIMSYVEAVRLAERDATFCGGRSVLTVKRKDGSTRAIPLREDRGMPR